MNCLIESGCRRSRQPATHRRHAGAPAHGNDLPAAFLNGQSGRRHVGTSARQKRITARKVARPLAHRLANRHAATCVRPRRSRGPAHARRDRWQPAGRRSYKLERFRIMLRHRHGGDFDPSQGARRARCFGIVSGKQARGGPKSPRRIAGAQRARTVVQRGRKPL